MSDSILLAAAVSTTALAVSFGVVTALRHNDAANRIWTAGFAVLAAACLSTLLTSPDRLDAVEATALAAALPFLVISLGWGAALLDGRRTLVGPLSLAGAAAAAVLVALAYDTGAETASWVAAHLITAGLGLWAARQLTAGPSGHNLNARMSAASCAVAAAMLVAFCVPAVTDETSFAAGVLTVTALAVAVAPMLTALRVERSANWWATRDDTASRYLLGTLSRSAFEEDAAHRLERAGHLGVTMYLTLIRVDALSEINKAFGRDAGDAALSFTARVLAQSTPPTALLGHLGAGMFATLSVENGSVVESAVRTHLIHDPLPPLLTTRLQVSTAVAAATPESEYDHVFGLATAKLSTNAVAYGDEHHGDPLLATPDGSTSAPEIDGPEDTA